MRLLLLLSFLVLPFLVGCTSRGPDLSKVNDEKKAHDHGDGPNKGTVADWGEDGAYHVEFCVDHPTKTATVYILDGTGEKPARIKAESITLKIEEPAFEVELKAMPQKDDPKGTSSRFVGVHEALGKEQEFAGKIVGKADGVERVGKFKEAPEKK